MGTLANNRSSELKTISKTIVQLILWRGLRRETAEEREPSWAQRSLRDWHQTLSVPECNRIRPQSSE